MFNWLKKLFDNTEPEATGVRARTAKGHYVADDKSTPKVNEAYTDGKTPVKKAKRVVTKKAPVKKKAAPKKAPAKKGRAKKAPTKK
jgi:hypothetical protein|tara:strand:+ start:274 stop:531 length:258 start_codon:yes stop_codon:yes gene_type:complete